MNKIKLERLAGIIKKDVSDIIQFEVKEPNLGFITVTDVVVTNDCSFATIYVSILGNDIQKNQSLEYLRKAKGFIRSKLSKQLDIRKCPDLIFNEDNSLEEGNRIDKIIEEIKQKD